MINFSPSTPLPPRIGGKGLGVRGLCRIPSPTIDSRRYTSPAFSATGRYTPNLLQHLTGMLAQLRRGPPQRPRGRAEQVRRTRHDPLLLRVRRRQGNEERTIVPVWVSNGFFWGADDAPRLVAFLAAPVDVL